LVDAVPCAISSSSREQLAKRRSRPNNEAYRIDVDQFGDVIGKEIRRKQAKAETWIRKEPSLTGRLILLVNGGQGPLPLVNYFPNNQMFAAAVPLQSISPFRAVAVADWGGAYVWET